MDCWCFPLPGDLESLDVETKSWSTFCTFFSTSPNTYSFTNTSKELEKLTFFDAVDCILLTGALFLGAGVFCLFADQFTTAQSLSFGFCIAWTSEC